MNEVNIEHGLNTLDQLAIDEYRQSISEVVADGDKKDAFIRLGRLVGVLMKEPFAISVEQSQPSERTRAYRSWTLVEKEDFNSENRSTTWQYAALKQIVVEMRGSDVATNADSIYDLAWWAQNETGFFGYFAQTLRKYICGDPNIRKEIEKALKNAEKITGEKVSKITPEMVVGSGGLTLGVYLVQNIPLLGVVGAPAIAAVVVILYTIGVKAFCQWSEQLRTDADEKH